MPDAEGSRNRPVVANGNATHAAVSLNAALLCSRVLCIESQLTGLPVPVQPEPFVTVQKRERVQMQGMITQPHGRL